MTEATVDELRNFILKEYYGSDERAYLLAVDINREYRVVKRSSIQTIQETMTLRDYFAGQALSGLLNNEKFATYDDKGHYCAGICYQMADMMIKVGR